MDKISLELLKQIANLEKMPKGAYNFRLDGKSVEKNTTANIDIVSKKDKQGIDIYIKENTKNQSLHIPVIVAQGGIKDTVYNDFYIGDNCDVVIVAGCGIYNCTNSLSEHDGIHTFYVGKNSKVKYVEKHLGIGNENAERVISPTTKVYLKENSFLEMDTTQIGGVSYADRNSYAKLKDNAKLVIKENILTTKQQVAKTKFKVDLIGENSSVEVVSRSVAKDCSKQNFKSIIVGKNKCFGHVECDGIILDNAQIVSTPEIKAMHIESNLVHEAAIGKIAGDELIKLETLGLTTEEAEEVIIQNFMLN